VQLVERLVENEKARAVMNNQGFSARNTDGYTLAKNSAIRAPTAREMKEARQKRMFPRPLESEKSPTSGKQRSLSRLPESADENGKPSGRGVCGGTPRGGALGRPRRPNSKKSEASRTMSL